MQTCGTSDSFFWVCAKTSLILGIPKNPTISSFSRLCFGASKTVLFRTFPKSLRFFELVQKRSGRFFVAVAFPPSLPELLDSRDFSVGEGLLEVVHGGFPRFGLLLEASEENAAERGKAKQGRLRERERHGVVEEEGLVGHGYLRELRNGRFLGG